VERWFALITTQAIRRGSFGSVTDLKRKIEEFVNHYNQHPRPSRSSNAYVKLSMGRNTSGHAEDQVRSEQTLAEREERLQTGADIQDAS
jgi:hypothetical protein